MTSKINLHVRKIIEGLSIKDTSDRSIDLVVDNLTLQHREYQRKPQKLLREIVTNILCNVKVYEDLDSNSSISQVTNSSVKSVLINAGSEPVESLNKSLSSRYQNQQYRKKGIIYSSVENIEDNEIPEYEEEIPAITKKKVKKRKRPSSSSKVDTDDHDMFDDNTNQRLNTSVALAQAFLQPRPIGRLSDLAGLDKILIQVRELVFYPVQYPDLYHHLGVLPPCGLLLHGPSGCGKTSLAAAIAGELGLPFFKASGPELIGGTSGESEQRIREIFAAAVASSPSILFLDALDVIAAKRDSSQRGMDRRVVAQLLDSIDSLVPNTLTKARNPTTATGTKNANTTNTASNARDLLVLSEAVNGEANNGRLDVSGEEEETVSSKKITDNIVIFIAATNRPDSLDPAVRGRFDRELALPVPDAASRAAILRLITAPTRLSADVSFSELGRVTPGFVGADLKALVREAGVAAVRRIVGSSCHSTSTAIADVLVETNSTDIPIITENATNPNTTSNQITLSLDGASIAPVDLRPLPVPQSDRMCVDASPLDDDGGLQGVGRKESMTGGWAAPDCAVTMSDFLAAAKSVEPAATREGFAVVPDVTWDDVGALAEVREELLSNVLDPISHPERYRRLGLEVPAGVLFFGPPGCGKTLLAKALANQSGANFISVKGPELLNMYVGESESRVRQVFSRARASAPCVIFFDELDALCPKRGSSADSGNNVSERVVNQMLTELDGLETRTDVYIVAATNRLELIDDAMLRPGRLGKLLYVPLPSAVDRVAILRAVSRKVSLEIVEGFDMIESIGRDERTEGFSGADLAALVREAGMAVMREWRESDREATAGKESESTVTGTASTTTTTATASTTYQSEEVVDTARHKEVIRFRHFEEAFRRVKPSVSLDDRKRFERVQHCIRQGMGAVQALKAAKDLKISH